VGEKPGDFTQGGSTTIHRLSKYYYIWTNTGQTHRKVLKI